MVRGRPPAEPAPPARVFLMAANEWLDLSGWPPPGSQERELLSRRRRARQLALRRRTSQPVSARWRRAPRTSGFTIPTGPCPFITDASSAQIGGPDDYAGVETRGDVLVYTSDAAHRAARCDRTGSSGRPRRHLGGRHRHHGQAPRRPPERLRTTPVRRRDAAPVSGRPRACRAGRAGRRLRDRGDHVGHRAAISARPSHSPRGRVLSASEVRSQSWHGRRSESRRPRA